MSSGPSTQQIVEAWSERAEPYLALIRKWEFFTHFADRLVDLLPKEGVAVADIGGGTGLVTSRLLAKNPGARVTLFEPATRMLELARRELAPFGDRVEIVAKGAADIGPPASFDAALSSVVMHMLDEAVVFPAIASVLRPGGVFAFNYWGHSYEDTATDRDPVPLWRAALGKALKQAGMPEPRWPEPVAPRPRKRVDIEALAKESGLELNFVTVDSDEVKLLFFIDFIAMSPKFLGRFSSKTRAKVLERVVEITDEPIVTRTARIRLEKVEGG